MAKRVKRSKKSRKIHIPYLPHLIIGAVLVAIIILIKGDGFLEAKGPSQPLSPVQVSVVAPNGGEKFVQGQTNTISWKEGFGAIAVGLATADSDTNHAIALPPYNTPYTGPQQNGTTGHVIGFIKTTENGGVHLPNSSIVWDGLKVCNFHLNMDPDVWCVDVTPGNYKIFVWSEGENHQSMCIGSGNGPTGKYTASVSKSTYGCNWDLSDRSFTILAP